MMKTSLIALLFCLVFLPVVSQNKITILDTANSGIPSNKISALYFDNDSLWVGTNDKGIAMFDGSGWNYYNTNNTPALQSDYINDIIKAPNGDMWFGTGLGIAVKSSGGWMFYDTTVINYYQSASKKYQLYVQFDSNGDAYTISLDPLKKAVMIYKFSGGSWTMIHRDTTVSWGFGYPKNFVIDQNDDLWVKDGWHFDGTKWNEIKKTNPNWRYSTKRGVTRDNNNNIWFYLADLGKSATETVFKYDGTNLQEYYHADFTRYGEFPGYLTVNPYNNELYSAAQGIAWHDGNNWNKDTTLNNVIFSSPLTGIKTMAFDKRGNVWIGLNNSLEFYKTDPEFGGIIIYNRDGVNLSNYPVGIKEVTSVSREGIDIYPNPFTNVLTIKVGKETDKGVIELLNTEGKLVLREIVKEGNNSINTSALPAGIYFFRTLHDGKEYSAGKLIRITE